MSKKSELSLNGLYIVIITTTIATVFILIHPFNQTPLRIIFALVLLLFLPGYVFISTLFPGRNLNGFERFVLSIGMSIVIIIFDGFFLDYFRFGFNITSISLSIILFILFFAIVASIRRSRIPDKERYIINFNSIKESLRSKEKASDIEKALISILIISIILAGGMFIQTILSTQEDNFTSLYILGPLGKAEDYQTDLKIGEPSAIVVGIENYEHAPMKYTLVVRFNQIIVDRKELILEHRSKRVQNISFTPEIIGNNLKLEFLLYKEGEEEIYLSNHLWINSTIDTENTEIFNKYLIEPPKVSNWDMEKNNNWTFIKQGDFNGSYVNYFSELQTRSYMITLPSETASTDGDFGAAYQDIISSNSGIVVLMFDVMDSRSSNETEVGHHYKQVLINNIVVWEDDVAGDEDVQHVEIPIMLKSGGNRLMFSLYDKKGVSSFEIKTWWDNVMMKSFEVQNIKEPDKIINTKNNLYN